MPGITHIASFSARLGSTVVPAQGFGTPLIATFHTVFPELVRQYGPADPSSILAEMVADGFIVNSTTYKLANAALGQANAPRVIKIGRLGNAPAQILTLTPVNVVEGSIYTLTFANAQGSEVATYTVESGDTADDIATALHTAINAFATCTDLDSADNTGSLTVDCTASGGTFEMDWTVNGKRQLADLTLLDGSTAASIATDLTAIETEDSDWYGLILGVESAAISELVGDWIATRQKAYFCVTSDTGASKSGTSTDIGSVMASDANNRVVCLFSASYRTGRQARAAGFQLPTQPGSGTLALKQLRGDIPDDLTSGQFAALKAKRYTYLRKLNATQAATEGGFVSGEYVYFDILRSFDWTVARTNEAIASLLLSNSKIPFTAVGLALAKQAMERVVANAVANGVLSAGDPDNAEEDPVPAVVLPRIGEQGADLTARTARELSEVAITGRFQGAVHSVVGTVVLGF